MKKALLVLMAVVFAVFDALLVLGFGKDIGGVNLAIITPLILIGLFVGFIVVSTKERKRGGDGSIR